ncbi:MAG: GNAT family N-acetyltransferase [Candidatus Limnocylindrales bacterium]
MAGDREIGSGGGPVLVRRALPVDARAIAEVTVRGWQAAYRGILPEDFLAGLSLPAREVAWRSMLESDEEGAAPAWVAERNGETIGFAASGPPRDADVPLPGAEVYALYVLPEEWGTGIGRSLLETAVGHWRSHGCPTLVLWVLEANGPARAFYEAMGWEPDGGRQRLEIAGTSLAEIRYRLAQAAPPRGTS